MPALVICGRKSKLGGDDLSLISVIVATLRIMELVLLIPAMTLTYIEYEERTDEKCLGHRVSCFLRRSMITSFEDEVLRLLGIHCCLWFFVNLVELVTENNICSPIFLEYISYPATQSKDRTRSHPIPSHISLLCYLHHLSINTNISNLR